MNFSIIAGLGPLGTPELIILSILIGIVAIPILAVIAVVVFLARKKSKSGSKDGSPSATPPSEE
jgi:hypothetical protein